MISPAIQSHARRVAAMFAMAAAAAFAEAGPSALELAPGPLKAQARVVRATDAGLALTSAQPSGAIRAGMFLQVHIGGAHVASVRVDDANSTEIATSWVDSPPVGVDWVSAVVVAPIPIPVTSMGRDGAYIGLPPGHGLTPGTLLKVVRDGTLVGEATLRVADDGPVYADPQGAAYGALRLGDECYATDEIAADVALPPPVADVEDVPLDANPAVVSSIVGRTVYLLRAPGSPAGRAGERVGIERDGQWVATIVLSSANPPSGLVEAMASGATIRVGDMTATAPEMVAAVPVEAGPTDDTPARRRDPAPDRAPSGVALPGHTGLIRVPSADVQPVGRAVGQMTFTPSGTDRTALGSRDRFALTVGVLPGLEAGVAFHPHVGNDKTANVKLQLLRESSQRPAVAVGATDVGSSDSLETTYYAVGTKDIGERTRVTLGVAAGGTEGLLAGVETALTRDLTLLADYDTRGVNVGARFAPSPNVQMDVARVSDGWAGSISLSTDLAPDRPHIGPVVLPQPQFSDGPQNLAERLQAVTCGLGMENVKALVGEGEHGETAVVYYENRTYLHSELTALWQVVAAVVAELPPSVARVCIITRKQGVPVFRFAVSPDDYVRFLNGEIPIGDFQPMCDVGHGTDSPVRLAGASGRTRIAQSTRYTADLAINPVVQTLIGSETAHLSQRYGVRPSLEVPLGHGLSINLSRQVRVGGSLDKNIDPFVRITDTVANVSALFRPTDYSVGRVAVGDLLGGRRGAAGEAVALVADGRSVLRGTAGWITEREYDDYRWFYVGDARYHIPRLDATATVTFGQYLEGDTGATVGLRKYLGDLEMDAQYRDTNYGRILMVGATLPIGSRKDRRPDPVRIRESSRFAQHFRAETEDPVTGDTSVVGASSIGNQLPLFDLTDEYLDRDRLNATYLWSHPEAILAGARRVLARR